MGRLFGRGSRFEGDMDPLALKLTSSLDQDSNILYYDILVDIAHVLGLLRSGYLSRDEAREIVEALLEIREFGLDEVGEDVHEALEKAVTKRTKAGKKMHTARSRNDEVATCLRMFARDKLLSIAQAVLELRCVLIDRAEENLDVIMPGFTHLQYAQPTRLSHHLISYHDMLKREFDRVLSAFSRINFSPLGSCAFAGTSFKIDRIYTSEILGFDGVVENTCDAVSSRDFLIESIFVSTSLMLTLSRMCEEVVLWSSEFEFIELPDEFSSTSSIMPQKKNPDVAEIVRAKAGRCIGELASAMSIYKGLPLTYNRDFQEMNTLMYSALNTAELSTIVMVGMFSGIKFKVDVMVEKAVKGFSIASEIADRLAKSGVPFRDAHAIVGKAVARGDLGLVKEFAREMGYDVEVEKFDLKDVVNGRDVLGGTSRFEVERMIGDRRKSIEVDSNLLFDRVERVCRGLERLYSEVESLRS
ncbi:MAG: argininosuccinate lyase [Archaeoglobales archaeon]|nr:MAG: argininosuccinate lyase [Archaeoglobales archaeon]